MNNVWTKLSPLSISATSQKGREKSAANNRFVQELYTIIQAPCATIRCAPGERHAFRKATRRGVGASPEMGQAAVLRKLTWTIYTKHVTLTVSSQKVGARVSRIANPTYIPPRY